MKEIERIREILTDGHNLDVEDMIEIEQCLKAVEDMIIRRDFPAVNVLKQVKDWMENIDVWWINSPDKGGFDMKLINNVVKNDNKIFRR